jgi:hypothetical protein
VFNEAFANVKPRSHEGLDRRANAINVASPLCDDEDTERSDYRNVETLGTTVGGPVVDDRRPSVVTKPVG